LEFEEIKIWFLLAGLGLFLFGMSMLEDSLKGLVGRSFKRFLRKSTNRPIQAVFSGTVVTAILQSSSMVSLLVMSLAGAGIIGLESGIGMIMGANLGTTATGWLVSLVGFKLDIVQFVYPFIAVSGLGIILIKNDRLLLLFKFLMGFSFMFMGLDFMKGGFAEFAEHLDLTFLEGKPWIIFFLVGIALSALIQSSSAAMMIYLSSLAAGIISLDQAYYLVIGSDIGTTVTALIGTIGGNAIRKKVGWSQFTFNLFTAMIALIFMDLIDSFLHNVLQFKDPTVALVGFHSSFNLIGILVFLPFIRYFTAFINKFIRVSDDKRASFICFVNPEETNASMEALEKESERFVKQAIDTNAYFFNGNIQLGKSTDGNYYELKMYEAEVADFYMKVLQQSLQSEEVVEMNHLIASFRNATLSVKDLKDVKHNLDQLKNSGSDHLYGFHKRLCENQLHLYEEVKKFIENLHTVSITDLEHLKVLHLEFYRKESESMQEAFRESHHRDIDMPSLLNMLREVNNSNEALLRSLQHLKGLD
jgi:phosphate:Na+ symporter